MGIPGSFFTSRIVDGRPEAFPIAVNWSKSGVTAASTVGPIRGPKERGGLMEKRREFLEALMRMANLKDLEQANDAARAVISLTKLVIGESFPRRSQMPHHPIFVKAGNRSRLLRRITSGAMNAYSKQGRQTRNWKEKDG